MKCPSPVSHIMSCLVEYSSDLILLSQQLAFKGGFPRSLESH